MTWPVMVDDVRAVLQPDETSDLPDQQITPYADAAMTSAEAVIGPRRGQPLVTLAHHHRGGTVVLDHAAAAVTSVTVDGAEATGWVFDPDEPQFVRGVPRGDVKISYIAPTTVPDDVAVAAVALACHRLLQDLPVGVGAQPAMGFATPNRCAEVFAAHAEVVL